MSFVKTEVKSLVEETAQNEGSMVISEETSQNERTTDITVGLFSESSTLARIKPYIVILLQSMVIAFLIVVISTDIFVQRPGILGSSHRALYNTGTTVVVTTVSTFTMSLIRMMWLQDILEGQRKDNTLKHQRVRRARTLLGIGVWQDSARFYTLTLSLLFAGLMTTAIVAGIALTNVLAPIPFPVYINTGYVPDPSNCWLYQSDLGPGDFGWRLSNGSYIVYNNDTASSSENSDMCAAQHSKSILDQTSVRPNYAFQAQGVQVKPSALGTPFSTYHGFDDTFATLSFFSGSSHVNTSSACVPNVVMNPVQCHRAGSISTGPGFMSISSGNCSYNATQYHLNPTVDDVSVSHVCTDGHNVGQATVLLGSTNRLASNLSSAMGDDGFHGTTYAVECTIDIAPSIGFRNVSYTLSPDSDRDAADTFTVTGTGQTCAPFSSYRQAFAEEFTKGSRGIDHIYLNATAEVQQILGPETLATGVGALTPLLTENLDFDGSWPTLFKILNHPLPSGKAYSNSQHALEDGMGITIASVLGLFWGVPGFQKQLVLTHNAAMVQSQRIGSQKWWAIVYIVPEVFAVALIVTFLWRQHWRKRTQSC